MSATTTTDNVAKAVAAWGNPPDWIMTLAEACDAESQAAVGRRISYSGATVSLILANKYGSGDLVRLEAAVRGVLMAETVVCPVSGDEMGKNVCSNWQKRPFSTASSNAVRMYQGCRSGCPHSRLSPIGDAVSDPS